MEKTNLSDGLMAQMIEEEAWKSLSGDYPWNESLLEKYKDKVDWEVISSNYSIEWTISMLEKFKGRIDWTGLSGVSSENLLIPDVVERFKDCWDWKVLSGNNNLPIATIRKMADYIDWKELINSRYNDEIFGMSFLKEFEDRIPAFTKTATFWQFLFISLYP